MIELVLSGLPILLDMALLALVAFLALMFIVFLMAGNARGFQFVVVQVAGMAILAFGGLVFAAQGVLGVLVMVEQNVLPDFFVVATLAFSAELAFVLVVLLMAPQAIHRRVLEYRALVASVALDLIVLAMQRETGLVVIEARVIPITLRVAVTA